jgi:hypothetical protein
MWINVTKDVFENSDFKGLNYLYQVLTYKPSDSFRSRYNIVVDTEKVKDTPNFKKLSSIEKSLVEFLDLEYSYFKTYSQNISYKISSIKNDCHFNIEEALIFLNQPVSIILENNKNDSEFILSIIKHFGNDDGYNKSQEHINNAYLKFENAGGCGNIPNFVEGFLKQFKDIATKNNRNLSEYFRGIIILDSDTEYPNQLSRHTELLRKLNDLGIDSIKVHILEKRMMENYLPDEVYKELKENNQNNFSKELIDWIDAYLNLKNDKQKDYINIPKGNLLGNEIPKLQGLIDFWEVSDTNISQVNYNKLNIGFKFNGFDEKGNIKKENDFKNAFPQLFKKATKEDLEKRIQHQPKLKSKVIPKDITERNEFEHIIHEIKYLL